MSDERARSSGPGRVVENGSATTDRDAVRFIHGAFARPAATAVSLRAQHNAKQRRKEVMRMGSLLERSTMRIRYTGWWDRQADKYRRAWAGDGSGREGE
jgi:hypothetical protein